MNSKEKEISKIMMCIMAISLIIGLKTQGGIPSRRNEVQDKTSFSNSDVIYVDDLKDSSREQENIASEIVKLTKKEDFIRQYDNDIYVEDYLDVKERLDEEFSKYLEEKFEKDLNRDFVVIADMEYYNPTLKQAKEENWTLEDILKEPTKHVRTFEFDFYCYTGDIGSLSDEEREKIMELDSYLSKQYEFYKGQKYKTININIYGIKKEKYSKKEIVNEDSRIEKTSFTQKISNKGGKVTLSKDIKIIKESLNNKYDLEFELKSVTPRTKYGKNQFIWKEKPYIVFDTQNIGIINESPDKFLTALAQSYMYDLVYEILEEEGVDDFVIPITIPFYNDYYKTDMKSYDVSKIKTKEDIIKFLNEGYVGDYDTTLVYLKEKDEEINYEMLKRVSEKIMKFIVKDMESDIEGGSIRLELFVEYYELEKEKRNRVKYLFNKDRICSAIYREDVNLGNTFRLNNMTREEIEGFHYLDIFAEKVEDKLNCIQQESEEIKNMTVEEFIKRTTKDRKY